MSAYGDRMRELCQGYDGNLELIERGERMAEELVTISRRIENDGKRLVLGGYSISFHAKPVGAEKAGATEPCEHNQP